MQDPNQNNASQGSNEDLPEPTFSVETNQAGKKSADQPSNQPDGQVTDTAKPSPPDEHSSQPSGDDTAYDPDKDRHGLLLFSNTKLDVLFLKLWFAFPSYLFKRTRDWIVTDENPVIGFQKGEPLDQTQDIFMGLNLV